MDCNQALTTKTGAGGSLSNPLSLTYDSVSPTGIYEAGYTALFDNADPTGCPITECLLMDGTCSTTPAVNANFYITSAGTGGTPWSLNYNKGLEAGWT
jgi:hypothetical protein